MSTKILNEPNNLLAQTLSDLINQDGGITPAALARKLGIPTNKITRILNGDVTDPKGSTLLQIASCFGISIDQLLGREPIVRKGEYGDLSASQMLPVFNMSDIDDQRGTPKEWYRWVENDLDGDYFAVSVNTDLYEPTFPKDSLLVINTNLIPEDRSFVLIKKNNNLTHYLIKKFVIDGDQSYLYPINPKLSIEVYNNNLYEIAGIILEVHQKLRSNK